MTFIFLFTFSFVTCLVLKSVFYKILSGGFVFLLLFIGIYTSAQEYKIRGFVYDSSGIYPLEAVSVLSTSGKGTSTNADGFYEIEVKEKDSIWFSYLNKPTRKFPVSQINYPFTLNISLQVNIPELKEVKIRQRNYRLDSIQNRQEYAKIFNYEKPGLKTVSPQYGFGVGFDLDELINMFRFRRNKSMLSFQQRLLQQERDKFIDHRFSKALVRRLTSLSEPELDSFMLIYRPSYGFTQSAGDYEFHKYIKDSGERFKKGLPPLPYFKLDDE
jgi:hypothetical protein